MIDKDNVYGEERDEWNECFNNNNDEEEQIMYIPVELILITVCVSISILFIMLSVICSLWKQINFNDK